MPLTVGKYYEIESTAYANRVVNLYGNHSGSSIKAGNTISLYAPTGDVDQKWAFQPFHSGYKLVCARNAGYIMNRHSSDNSAIAWPEGTANVPESELIFEAVSASANTYKIKLNKLNQYLTAVGPGSTLYFRSPTGAANQVFRMRETTGGGGGGELGSRVFNGHIVSHGGAGRCLNVYGNETISNNRNVCLWSWSDTNAQTWDISFFGSDLKVFSRLSHPTYALNVYRNGSNNCDVYPHVGNDSDSHVWLTGTGSDTYYIRLKSSGLALTAKGNFDNANVCWETWTGSDEQKWYFTTKNTKPGEQPGASLFKGHIVSHAGSGRALNVHGNESISNNRNVNLWDWSETNAQTWDVAKWGSDYKVFSLLSYPTYALNILRNGTNNCDVYPHVGNDSDSVVYLTGAGTNCYYVRLRSTGKTLTAAGSSVGSEVTWEDYTGNQNQKWMFTNTNTNPTPPPEEGTADSTLVTRYMQAYSGNYTPNRSANGGRITEITIHHCAGVMTIESLGRLWQTAGRGGSSHYGVNGSTIGQYVMEKDIAWTNGHWASNCRAVTIETSNSAMGNPWPVSEATFSTLIRLVADIAKRNKLGKLVVGANLTWHSMYAATECPGPTLLSRMSELAARANSLNGHTEGGNEPKGRGLDFLFPLPSGTNYTSYDDFDPDNNFLGRTHRGRDYTCAQGTTIRAAGYGKVLRTYNWQGGTTGLDSVGNAIWIEHYNADGSTAGMTAYFHIDEDSGHTNRKFFVSAGDMVEEGQKIAEVGTTGGSSGYHLHFEVKRGSKLDNTSMSDLYNSGTWVDPANYINRY